MGNRIAKYRAGARFLNIFRIRFGGYMELTITANNTTLTDAIKAYAEKRLSILDRRFRDPVPVFLQIRKEQTRKEEDRFIAEVTIKLNRGVIRGEMRGDSPYTAVDNVSDTVTRQISRYKNRYSDKNRRGSEGGLGMAIAEQLAQDSISEVDGSGITTLEHGQLVRTKRHRVRAESVEDAAAQMELLGHNFYLFRNKETEEVNVVYRRHDEDYGLIVPDDSEE
ncbi:MAG: ribosome-associated translation inhibitor RaiA [Chloroflexi bacterium]|jgi:putative sigma-54 modulation protein|nr:ribosome-associated translation inhibitor RaiA [Chloroflexota bacterium]